MDNRQGIEMEDEFLALQSPQPLFQKIDCFVTLGQYDLDEDENENFPQHIQIEQPEIKNFRLHKFFNAEPEVNQFVQKQQEVQHEPRMRPQRKMSQSLPSFMEEIDTLISQAIERQNVFLEQQKYNDALNNIDNFTFLEQSLSQPQVFKSFYSQYIRTINKLKLYRKQKRLDVKQFMAFVCSLGIEFIQETFNLIHKADSSWCFELLKLEGLTQQMQVENQQQLLQDCKLQKTQFQQQPFSQKQHHVDINKEQYKAQSIQSVEQQQHAVNQQSQQQSALSIVNEAIEKKGRKTWSNKEMETLQNFINTYQNSSITNQQIQDLSKQLGRTWYSVQSKIQKLKKNVQDQLSDVRSQSMKDDPSKEQLKMQRISTKYDYTVEDMIKITLQQLEGKCGTKQKVIESINQNFFNGQLSEDSACLRSISITLSNNRSQFIRKIKGYFGLNENYQDRGEDDNKMRNKLVWILQNLPEKRGTLQQIVASYTENSFLDEANNKKLQKQISQTLRLSNRFDKRNAKTIYKIQD
ncbi:unnamed protein product (macronuclear) [Paramecium tetraurelia]|uniref:Myb-like domain-containing protein n=1 Tax=Paramecium tetraurelia TaxID=5888 RepID=A0E451_PARTE|nr:uncharacterized protein GSPATT00023241001 [Paramecium tetraurelia]CAK90068.1 unnamed protein product [Paramecium tetraurelia]|eukprot:XP_001457465.1 hypothetical protein (macronuclear) [Paramecium tetraurelia strain d4-2]